MDLSLEYVHRINELLSAYPMESDEEIVKELLTMTNVTYTYAIQSRVFPLVETGQIKMSIPEKPKSPKQLFYSE